MRIVRLLVESPRYEENPPLNDLKRELVKVLMDSDSPRVIQSHGYVCDEAHLKRNDAQMQDSKTTTVFKIISADTHSSSPEANIEAVHGALSASIEKVLRPFEHRLNEYFGQGNP
jgi:hypothetical protein